MAGASHNSTATIKLLCSYGGKILPRFPDGKLRYHGGQTRLLSVDRSLSFSELLVKLGEICGTPVNLRCQLPTEDLDALVSITSDEDLVNLIEEYDLQSVQQLKSLKIKAFLSIPKKPSPSLFTSTGSGSGSSSSAASTTTHEGGSPKSPVLSATVNRCVNYAVKPPVQFPVRYNKYGGKVRCYGYGNPSRNYLVHNGK